MSTKTKVLIVDDSKLRQKMLREMIEQEGNNFEVVGCASDGYEAINKTKLLSPDVITMDIVMPQLDGIEATKRIMKEKPTPIVIVSSTSKAQIRFTVEALSYGAVEFIPITTNLEQMQKELIKKLYTAAKIKVVRYIEVKKKEPIQKHKIIGKPPSQKKIVVIGVSTGGPTALLTIFKNMSTDFPAPIVVVQHMVEGFTEGLAEWLNTKCEIKIVEAKNDYKLEPCLVLICPGGYNMIIKDEDTFELVKIKEDAVYKPTIDETFISAAKVYKRNTIGVILTGMGKDGIEGAKYIKKYGGKMLAQDKDSCIVYGMPKLAVEEGCIDKVVKLDELSSEIMNLLKE